MIYISEHILWNFVVQNWIKFIKIIIYQKVIMRSVVYQRPKVFGQSWRFLTFDFAFGCRRSMQSKAEGLAEGWNIWNSVNLSANFVTKILEWSKCMFVQCSKRFEILYYIISIRAFQSLCLNMPTKYLNTKYQTFGFTFGFDFEGRSFSTFAFGFGYGQKNHLR